MRFVEWFQRGFTHVDRAKRVQQPPLCAYSWSGGSPAPIKIKDISTSGAYLYMSGAEMWYPGTILAIVLQKDSGNADVQEPESISVSCRVVRHGPDGIGVAFIFDKPEERKSLKQFLERTLKHEMRAIVTRVLSNAEGQALVEFALMVPMLCLLIVNAVNFGAFFFGWITVANAARAGAQYAIMAGASVNSPPQTKASAVSTLITNDFVSLLNGSSPTVNVCIYSGSTIQPSPYQLGTCSGSSSDPESARYVGAVVDVTYTYTPPIPLFDFPKLGVHATLPPTTIHRRTYMRLLQ